MPRALSANVNMIISACWFENWQVNSLSVSSNFKPPGGSEDKKSAFLPQKQILANSL